MKLRERVNTAGTISWQVDYGIVDGKRKKVSFPDKEKAEAALKTAKEAQVNLGALGLKASPTEMAEFLAVKARLPAGVSVLEAVEYFMQHGLKVTKPILVPALVEDFLWSREELSRDARTIQTYRTVHRSLARAFPLKQAHDLTRDDIKLWRRSQGWAPSTQNKAVAHVRGLVKWAQNEKHMAHDPCEGLEDVTVILEEVQDLSVEQCKALLTTALRVPRFMFYICLGLFRGMRRAELERLRFEEIDAEEGTAIAAAKKVKTRRRRVIHLPANAWEWINAAGWTPEMMRTGPVAPSNLKDLWPRCYSLAGIKEWPHNGLRHTCASMHYAMHEDETALQAILGQASKDVFHTNYKALKSKREAEEFWGLRPPAGHVPLVWSLRDPVFKFAS